VRARERARARPTWAADIVRDGATLTTRRPLVIDVGAAGKGYLVDIVSAILQQTGVARFARAIPALVVGRNIDEVNLSKVAGSSGTPEGFNAAIQRIKAQATA
jgi:hypothetical protein